MEMVEVEITGMAITARYGTLQTGAILRTDADYAAHLVNDCGAAKYTTAKACASPASTEKAPASAQKPKKALK